MAVQLFNPRAAIPSPGALALLALGLAGCGGCGKGDEPGPYPAERAQTQALQQATPAPEPTPEPEPAPEPPPAKYPKPGFTEIVKHDIAPLCTFASYVEREKANFVEQVTKQTLKAGSSVVFGAFAPWCVHEDCDDRPSLQCWVDRKDDTLTVHSKYFGDHKEGSSCTENCRPIVAGCETPPLDAGKYTVQYGERSFELKIPSVLKQPCLSMKD